MSEAIVRAFRDTFVDEAHPSAPFPGRKVIALQAGAGVRKRGLIWWKNPTPDDPPATNLPSVLRLYGKGAWGAGTVSVSIQRLAAGWKQSDVDWNSQPATTGPTVTITQANPTDATEWPFDLTTIVQTITNGAPNYGFLITTTSTTERDFYSYDAVDFAPVADIAWSDAPDAPTTLRPSGGRAVGVSKPVLRFDYVDPSGADELIAVRVQINHGSAVFTAPTFDSGAGGVTTDVPQLDLSTTGYGGLLAGTTAYWRVMVKDAAGNWSTWSDPESFVFVAKAALTLGNPAVSPNNFVVEPTPPIFWTFAGTQTAWRLRVALDADPLDYLFDSRKRNGTGASFTLPGRIIVDQGAPYRITLDVWDNVDREATPGDPATIRIVRTFTFKEDGTPNPVTTLAVVQPTADRPVMKITFQRSTASDSFVLVRDGQTVRANVDPAAAFVSGTSYAIFDREADPNVEHTWKVQAVVNGKTSGVPGTANPTVLGTPKTGYIWLFDPDSDLSVAILGALDAQSYVAGEISSTLEPLEGKALVNVVQTLRGLEGTIAGRIADAPGVLAKDARANMRYWRRHPKTELRLTLGNSNYRVQISKVTVAPTKAYRNLNDRSVEFTFASLDGA